MKWTAAVPLLTVASFAGIFGASLPDSRPAPLTIAYSFDRHLSPEVMAAMQAELAKVLELPGKGPDWRGVATVQGEGVSNELVVVRFKGTCEPRMAAPWVQARGVLGDAAVVDGSVLPFAAVDCNRIRSVLGYSMSDRTPKASLLLGRALGRVVAHEIYHILGSTMEHTRTGITKRYLASEDLTAEELPFEPRARNAIHTRFRRVAAR